MSTINDRRSTVNCQLSTVNFFLLIHKKTPNFKKLGEFLSFTIG
ncbi:MAG: hypothetical protein ACRC62_06970 [Microcoleus sp.]